MKNFILIITCIFTFSFAAGPVIAGGIGNNGMPTNEVVKILKEAKIAFTVHEGINMSLGQWMQEYSDGDCTIVEVDIKTFRVSFGGCVLEVLIAGL